MQFILYQSIAVIRQNRDLSRFIARHTTTAGFNFEPHLFREFIGLKKINLPNSSLKTHLIESERIKVQFKTETAIFFKPHREIGTPHIVIQIEMHSPRHIGLIVQKVE